LAGGEAACTRLGVHGEPEVGDVDDEECVLNPFLYGAKAGGDREVNKLSAIPLSRGKASAARNKRSIGLRAGVPTSAEAGRSEKRHCERQLFGGVGALVEEGECVGDVAQPKTVHEGVSGKHKHVVRVLGHPHGRWCWGGGGTRDGRRRCCEEGGVGGDDDDNDSGGSYG